MFLLVFRRARVGELGHQLIARTAAKLMNVHPLIVKARKEADKETLAQIDLFIDTMEKREFQMGHVANIPDIYWRSVDGDLREQAAILGNPTHYLNPEKLLPKLGPGDGFAGKIPLAYLDAKKLYDSVSSGKSFFLDAGTAPWRAQQLADLYRGNLVTFLSQPCDKLNPQQAALARTALTYAGIMSHFTGDASQPFHSTSDHDGGSTGQRGVHWYFENHLVNALENELVGKVYRRAKMLLTAPASQKGSVADFRARAKLAYPAESPSLDVAALVSRFFRTATRCYRSFEN